MSVGDWYYLFLHGLVGGWLGKDIVVSYGYSQVFRLVGTLSVYGRCGQVSDLNML